MCKPSGQSRRTRGFTMPEVLVVVATIAVLIALLLPALVKARRSAVQITCASNLRQIALVNQFYLNEYHDYYMPMKWGYSLTRAPGWPPLPTGLALPTVPHENWVGNWAFRRTIGLNLKGADRVPIKFVCPLAAFALQNGNVNGYQLERSYGYNTDGLSWYANPTTFYMGYKRRDVRSPARKLMFADAMSGSITKAGAKNYDKTGEFWGLPAGGGKPVTNITAYRHTGGANVAFWDGHVEYLKRIDIVNKDSLWRVKLVVR